MTKKSRTTIRYALLGILFGVRKWEARSVGHSGNVLVCICDCGTNDKSMPALAVDPNEFVVNWSSRTHPALWFKRMIQ